MRRRFVITYDVRDKRRLRRTFKTMRRYGDSLQLSVFECLLSDAERIQLEDDLRDVVNEREDQVLFIDLGLAEAESPSRVAYLGQPYEPRQIRPVIV